MAEPDSCEFEVAVVGGGIAGLTAGLTAARLGRSTLVVAGPLLGGQLLSIARVDGYPGFPDGVAGYDLCPMAQEQAAAAGADCRSAELRALEPRDGAWQLTTDEGETTAAAVILATGAQLEELGVPGEARFRGAGVSHCASCDAPLHRGKVVAVVGGGDSAAQEALTLADFAAKVIVIHRGDELSAQAAYRAEVAGRPNIEVRFSTVVEEIVGDANVTGLRSRNVSTGERCEVAISAIFIYVGLRPSLGFLGDRLALDPHGRIPVDHALATALPGLYAAGAVRAGWPGRAVASAGDGALAAISADAYLRQHDLLQRGVSHA